MRRVWTKIKTRELPLIESLHQRLVRHCPPQRHTGVVHNDYRLGNLMLDENNTVAAVLDWKLTASGDVRADLGALLNNWGDPEDSAPAAPGSNPCPRAPAAFPAEVNLRQATPG